MKIIIRHTDPISDKDYVVEGHPIKINVSTFRKWTMAVDKITVDGVEADKSVYDWTTESCFYNGSSSTKKGVAEALKTNTNTVEVVC